MTEDFALIDFAVSARSPAEIAAALGQIRTGETGDRGAAAGSRVGFLSKLLGRGRAKTSRAERKPRGKPLMIQPDGTLGPGPLTRLMLTDMGFGSARSPVRLTAPIGAGGLTLIEFREADGEISSLCLELSEALRGDELFYFRYSGGRHPGAHFAFHVYQDGRATRQAVSRSADGTAPEADWIGIDSGMPHPLETDSLPPPGTPAFEVMTPVRQAAILEALGIDPESLFDEPEPGTLTLELSDAPGGLPLSSAETVLAAKRKALMTGGSAQVPEEVEAPAPARPTPPPPRPEPAPAKPSQAPTWEEEVTQLLVEAVEAALPPEQQVGWLDELTAKLVAGDVDAALEEARQMIAAGNRPLSVKHSAAARLAELFGRGA
ncbi:hypothetical protein [Tropicimonas sediminicola]|uniref:Uncharacterized protein n=1 Tax=Tropicimonas sediminicola TaxID=1031541 RepID=A0A239JXY6_9RHOB|nr:hypothetical protein [Tropicimonas sediminicola]SNT10847.1 hypothetical protein SAMN05421757_106140 [Tropicimonas sediminicola]